MKVLFLGLLFAAAVGARKVKVEVRGADAYDYLLLVRQWPGSFCSQHACPLLKHRHWTRFTIHGLWPNRNDGTWPQFCDSSKPFDAEEIDDLLDDLDDEWPSYMDARDSEEFWAHEWNKHGTCALPQLHTEHKFFKTVLKLNYRYKLEAAFHRAGIIPSATYKYTKWELLTAIRDMHGVDALIHCSPDGHLSEVWMCFDKDLEAIDCKPPSHNDQACSYVLIPPIPGSRTQDHLQHQKHETDGHDKQHEDDDDQQQSMQKNSAQSGDALLQSELQLPSSSRSATTAAAAAAVDSSKERYFSSAARTEGDSEAFVQTRNPSATSVVNADDAGLHPDHRFVDDNASDDDDDDTAVDVIERQDHHDDDNKDDSGASTSSAERVEPAEDLPTGSEATTATTTAHQRTGHGSARAPVQPSSLARTVCIASAGCLVGVIVIMTLIGSWSRRVTPADVAVPVMSAQLVIPVFATTSTPSSPSPASPLPMADLDNGAALRVVSPTDYEAVLRQPLLAASMNPPT